MNQIPMKQWRHETAIRLGISPSTVAQLISPTRKARLKGLRKLKRTLEYPEVTRINKRVVLVKMKG